MPSTRYNHSSLDTIQKVVKESYAERVYGSFGGAALGAAVTVGGCVALWALEHYHVRVATAIAGLAERVRTVTTCNPKNEGQVVHYIGAISGEPASDPRFSLREQDGNVPLATVVAEQNNPNIPGNSSVPNVNAPNANAPVLAQEVQVNRQALFIRRKVETFQWVEKVTSETQEKVGGSKKTTKTFSYSKQWSSRTIDSSQFEKQVNGPCMQRGESPCTGSAISHDTYNAMASLICLYWHHWLVPRIHSCHRNRSNS